MHDPNGRSKERAAGLPPPNSPRACLQRLEYPLVVIPRTEKDHPGTSVSAPKLRADRQAALHPSVCQYDVRRVIANEGGVTPMSSFFTRESERGVRSDDTSQPLIKQPGYRSGWQFGSAVRTSFMNCFGYSMPIPVRGQSGSFCKMTRLTSARKWASAAPRHPRRHCPSVSLAHLTSQRPALTRDSFHGE